MTNEEKLLKLLQIAVENGWENYYTEPNTDTIIIRNEMVSVKGCDKFSLNDLVTNFEEGEVSFIEALCREDNALSTYRRQDLQWKVVRKLWDTFEDGEPRPTSERLNWLFETFEHLLTFNQ